MESFFFNHLLTIVSNIINNQKLTDAHTCYKVFKSEIFKQIDLKKKVLLFVLRLQVKFLI